MTKRVPRWIATVILGSILLSQPAFAVSVTEVLLPNCTGAVMGFFYDAPSLTAWAPCYDTGFLDSVNFGTVPPTINSYDLSAIVGKFNIISASGDANNIYVSGRSSGQIFSVSKSLPTIATVLTSGLSVPWFTAMLGGFLYVAYNGGVAKIDPVTGLTTLINTGHEMVGIATDGVGDLVATAPETNTPNGSGLLYEIDPTANTATMRVSGMTSPVGVFEDSAFVYVAENNNNPGVNSGKSNVYKIPRSTWTITGSTTGSLTPPAVGYSIIVVGTTVAVSSIGDGNIYTFDQLTMNPTATILCPIVEDVGLGPQCRPLYTLGTDGVNLFVGFQGSNGIGKLANWQPTNNGRHCGKLPCS